MDVAARNPKTPRRWGVNWGHSLPHSTRSISLFVRYVNIYFRFVFVSPQRAVHSLPFQGNCVPSGCPAASRQGILSIVRNDALPGKSRGSLLLASILVGFLGLPGSLYAQAKPAGAAQKPSVGPPSPQSKHYPILLLAFGNAPNWSLRIGQKGPERFDREGYPPIPLESVEVTHEDAVDTWTYHAKDSSTGAAVAIRVSRGTCTDATSDGIPPVNKPAAGKFPFSASVEHAQTGKVKGCARIAAELFPRINNQPLEEDEEAKDAPPAPTVTNFKPPVAYAYLNSTGKLVFKKGTALRTVPAVSRDFSVSHDGSRLLYLREEKAGNNGVVLYDPATQKSAELVTGSLREPFWAPDDAHFAFLKNLDGKWQLWVGSSAVTASDAPIPLYAGDLSSLAGWVDAHTVLVKDHQDLLWLSDAGVILQRVTETDVLGDAFTPSVINTFRVHPLNSDLLLVSAKYAKPVQGIPVDDKIGGSAGLFLYELRSRRRVLLSTPNLSSQSAEWSGDGLQIFFTATDSGHHSQTNRIFWDGTGQIKFLTGTSLVVGQ